MNYIDLILVTVIILATWHGWRNGFLALLTEIVIWLGSLILAWLFSELINSLLYKLFDISILWLRPLFIISVLAFFSRSIYSSIDKIIGFIPEWKHDHLLNKIGGMVPGFLSGLFYALLLSLFFLIYPVGDATEKAKQSSIAGILTQKPDWAGEKANGFLNNIRNTFGRSLTIFPNGKEIISLPFKVREPYVRKDLEIEMLDILNEERKKVGLSVLYFDENLAKVARAHSKDMLRRGYFSHFSPEGKSPFDRIRKEGIPFIIAGENLALAQNLDLAHSGLMESPVHRANIQHRFFGRIGIGIMDSGYNGLMITQLFGN